MIVVLIRLLFLGVLLFLLIRLFGKKKAGFASGARSGKEICPSCQSPLAVRVSEDPGSCPSCGAELIRSPDGTLRIRVN